MKFNLFFHKYIKTVWRPHIPHQLFHLAACADEQSLIESHGGVYCSRIQL